MNLQKHQLYIENNKASH